jgi:5-methylcytosine-specific restriction endonuclease McrA
MAKLPNGEAAINDYFAKYKRGAVKRKITFELTREEFIDLVFGICHYCGSPPNRDYPGLSSSKKHRYNGHVIINGIDRKDPSLSYCKDNCVTACSVCNFGKQQLNGPQFEEWIKKVYKYLFGD